MSISNNYVPLKQIGNGVTTQFTASWALLRAEYAQVYLEDATTGAQTLQTLGTQYTITGLSASSFTVNFVTAPTIGTNVIIGRKVAITQDQPYKTSTGFQGYTEEQSFDKLTVIAQDLSERVDRCAKLPLGSTVSLFLPAPVAGRAIIWDPSATALVNGPNATDIANAQTVSAIAVQAAADAVAANSAAQSAAAGMKWRPSVRLATAAPLPSSTYANGTGGVGATITATANGALGAIDVVTPVQGDAILVKDEATQGRNGVYILTQLGTGSTPFILTRRTDADQWSELVSQVVAPEEGAAQADTPFICTVNSGGTVGTTAITWTVLPVPVQDGSITFAKFAAAAIASLSDILAGTASKILSAANFKSFRDAYLPAKVYTFTPAAGDQYVNITSVFRSGYNYRIMFSVAPQTDGVDYRLQFSSNNGTSYLATGAYGYNFNGISDTSGTYNAVFSAVDTSIKLNSDTIGNDVNEEIVGEVLLFDPVGRSTFPALFFRTRGYNTATNNWGQGAGNGGYKVAGAINALRLFFSSGNHKAFGKITVYEEAV